MDFGRQWCINVGSSVVTNVDYGEGTRVEVGVYGNLYTILSNLL